MSALPGCSAQAVLNASAPLHGLAPRACSAFLEMTAADLPPPSVAGLSRLKRACFEPQSDPWEASRAALPTGAWSGSLRQLAASHSVLLLSHQLLAAAGRLEQLTVIDVSCTKLGAEPDDAEGRRFLRWCATHPSLQQVYFEEVPTAPGLLAAVDVLRAARPALQVHLLCSPIHRDVDHCV